MLILCLRNCISKLTSPYCQTKTDSYSMHMLANIMGSDQIETSMTFLLACIKYHIIYLSEMEKNGQESLFFVFSHTLHHIIDNVVMINVYLTCRGGQTHLTLCIIALGLIAFLMQVLSSNYPF